MFIATDRLREAKGTHMSHPDAHQPVAYEPLAGAPRDQIEIVLNDRDGAAPPYLHLRDGNLARRLPSRPLPGQTPRIPKGWKPEPGVTRRLIDPSLEDPKTWELIFAAAAELASAMRTRGAASDAPGDLEAALAWGIARDIERGMPILAPIEGEVARSSNLAPERDLTQVDPGF